MTDVKTKAYSYLRFSTPEQSKGDSFRRQTKLAEEYARRHDLDLDTKLTFRDLGVSAFRGKNAETGKLAEFREAVQEGLIPQGSVLLVESLDRISRQSARRAVNVLGDIIDAGVDVVTLNDGKRYTSESLDSFDFLFAILLFIRANEESVTKGKRVREAWSAKRERASEKPLTSRCPAWLRMKEDRSGFDVIEERARVIRRIFDMTLEGIGQHKIAETLNVEGVPVFGAGKFWHRSYVKKILESPTVIGTLIPHELHHRDGKRVRVAKDPVPHYYPAVISDEAWEAVRAMSQGRKRVKASPVSPLAGLVRCALCGGTMIRVQKGKRSRPHYVCAAAKTGAGCEYHSAREDILVGAIEHNASWIAAQIPDAHEEVEQEIKKLEGQLEDIEHVASVLVDQIIEEPSEILRERLRETEKARIEAQEALQRLIMEKGTPIAGARSKALEMLAEGHVDGVALRTLFEAIEVDPKRKTAALKWKLSKGSETEIIYGVGE
jgi:DNA invertase Pin-like site-specific DNA recombinase